MEYKNSLTNTDALKKLNLRALQLELAVKKLEAENAALKDKLAKLVLREQAA